MILERGGRRVVCEGKSTIGRSAGRMMAFRESKLVVAWRAGHMFRGNGDRTMILYYYMFGLKTAYREYAESRGVRGLFAKMYVYRQKTTLSMRRHYEQRVRDQTSDHDNDSIDRHRKTKPPQ